jgi:hypothetical protein
MKCKELQAMLIHKKWEFISTDIPGERVMPKKGYQGPHIITLNRITMYYNYDPSGDGAEHRKYEIILRKYILTMSYKKLMEIEEERKTIVSAMDNIAEIPLYAARKCKNQKCDEYVGYTHASQDAYSILCSFQEIDSNWDITHNAQDGIITCPKCLEIMVLNNMGVK